MSELRELLTARFTNLQTGHRVYPPRSLSKDSVSSLNRMHLILSGTIEYVVDGEPVLLKAGDQSLATAWIRRRWTVVGDEPCEMVFCGFETAELLSSVPSLYLSSLPTREFQVEQEMYSRLHARHDDFFEPEDLLYVEGELKGSLARFFRSAKRHGRNDTHGGSGAIPAQVRAVQEFLLGHLADPDAMARLRDVVRITPNYLRRIFLNATGQTIGAFLLRIRMQRARYLLQSTQLSVKEVGVQVGFRDALHFSRRYSEFWNAPPSRDRKELDPM